MGLDLRHLAIVTLVVMGLVALALLDGQWHQTDLVIVAGFVIGGLYLRQRRIRAEARAAAEQTARQEAEQDRRRRDAILEAAEARLRPSGGMARAEAGAVRPDEGNPSGTARAGTPAAGAKVIEAVKGSNGTFECRTMRTPAPQRERELEWLE